MKTQENNATKAKLTKTEKSSKTQKVAKIIRERKLTLSDVNATLYGLGKSTLIEPVAKTNGTWSTSSMINNTKQIIVFSKIKGSVYASINGADHVTIENRKAVEELIENL